MFGFVKRNTLLSNDPYSRLSAYSAFVRSRVEYASIIWNPSGSVQINRIERLQKKFLNFALQSLHFTEPASPYDSQCSPASHLFLEGSPCNCWPSLSE